MVALSTATPSAAAAATAAAFAPEPERVAAAVDCPCPDSLCAVRAADAAESPPSPPGSRLGGSDGPYSSSQHSPQYSPPSTSRRSAARANARMHCAHASAAARGEPPLVLAALGTAAAAAAPCGAVPVASVAGALAGGAALAAHAGADCAGRSARLASAASSARTSCASVSAASARALSCDATAKHHPRAIHAPQQEGVWGGTRAVEEGRRLCRGGSSLERCEANLGALASQLDAPSLRLRRSAFGRADRLLHRPLRLSRCGCTALRLAARRRFTLRERRRRSLGLAEPRFRTECPLAPCRGLRLGLRRGASRRLGVGMVGTAGGGRSAQRQCTLRVGELGLRGDMPPLSAGRHGPGYRAYSGSLTRIVIAPGGGVDVSQAEPKAESTSTARHSPSRRARARRSCIDRERYRPRPGTTPNRHDNHSCPTIPSLQTTWRAGCLGGGVRRAPVPAQV